MPLSTQSELVVGTAGHIDHGKTTLVRALTGMETDRLAEEKRRGISIDLGFAHMTLPEGGVVSFVDVPGHERFVRNMLAGAAGIRAVMLIVAATESVMPQTQEHFEICRFLGIPAGIVVITKCDLASPEQIDQAEADVRALCRSSFLEGARAIRTSVVSGAGLNQVRSALAELQQRLTASHPRGFARLPVDRSFAMKGFGTVVTGTLSGGSLRSADSVLLQPGARPVRIRGLQSHGRAVDAVHPGERTAINLAGVDAASVTRGDVLTNGEMLQPVSQIVVSVSWLAGHRPPSAHEPASFHAGTAEVNTRVRVLADGFACLRLAQPVLALPGDRFILRRLSPPQTIGGGVILDLLPEGRRLRSQTVERLMQVSNGWLPERVGLFVREAKNGLALGELVRRTGLPKDDVVKAIGANHQLFWHESSQQAVTKKWIARWREQIATWLSHFHRDHPSEAFAPLAAARQKLPPQLSTIVFAGWKDIRIEGESIALASHQPQVNDAEQKALLRLELAFLEGGFSPPSVPDALNAIAADGRTGLTLLEQLVKTQRLVRIGPDLVFHVEAIAHIRASLVHHKGRRFSVPEFKQWTNISRKYAIPLLEYLDRQRVTRRDGDGRVVL